MKKQFTYLPYQGSGCYVSIICMSEDEPSAATVADILGSRGFRLSCDSCGGRHSMSPDEAAKAIVGCSGAIIFLSETSMESLAFRNRINYLLSLRKPIVCVRKGDFSLRYGLDMQLANIRTVPFQSPEKTAEELISSGVLTQEMVGMEMEKRSVNHKRTRVMLSMIAAAVLIFGACAYLVIQKHRSPAFLLKDADGSSYVDISQFGDEGLSVMKGKTVTELDLSGGTFSTLQGLQNVTAETVNVSDIPVEISLWPLTQMEGLKTAKISQSQIVYAKDLSNAGLTVVITH